MQSIGERDNEEGAPRLRKKVAYLCWGPDMFKCPLPDGFAAPVEGMIVRGRVGERNEVNEGRV